MVKAPGFESVDPGSKLGGASTFDFFILNGYAITIYLSSLKFIYKHQQVWWRKPFNSPLVCHLQAVPGWYVQVRILLLTHRDMTAAGCGNGLGTVMSLPRRLEREGNVRTGE